MRTAQFYANQIAGVLQKTEAHERRGLRKQKLPYGVPFQWAGQPVRGPQCATFALKVRDQDLKNILDLGPRLALATGSHACRVYRDHSVVRVEFTLPKGEWKEVPLNTLPVRPGKMAVGRQALGATQWLNWAIPHKAVFGATRTGKTVFLSDLIISAALAHQPDDYRFLILNPKNDPALRPFHNLAHLAGPMAVGYEDCDRTLRYALAEMEARRLDHTRTHTRWVVVVDEVAHLVTNVPEVSGMLTQLGQLAGGLNMNLVVASQSANPSVFGKSGTLARTNLGSRFVFQLPKEQSWLATGVKGVDTQELGGLGDGFVVADDRVARFRAALPSQADYDKLPRVEVIDQPRGEQVAPDRLVDRPVSDLTVTNPTYEEDQSWDVEELALRTVWAIMKKASAHAVRQEFGGGQKRADTISKLAAKMRELAGEMKK